MRHVAVQVAAAVIALVAGVFDLALVNTSIGGLQGNDFGKFFFGLHAWRVGWSLYTPTSATHMRVIGNDYADFLNLNPPHFHLLLLPIADLSLRTADYIWTASNLCAGVIAVWLVFRELGIRLRARSILPTLAMILACGATGAVLITGQVTGLMLLPLTLAWRALRRGNEWTAGMWLGLVVSIKPFLALFVAALMWRRDWRVIGSCSFVVLVGFGVGLAVFGVGEHIVWIKDLTQVEWVWAAMNGSWQAVLVRAFTQTPYAKATMEAPWLVQPLWVAGSGVVLVGTLAVVRRSVDHAFAAVTLGALLISPLGWVYYLWLGLPGMVGLWRYRVPTAAVIATVGLLVPFFVPPIGRFGAMLTLTVGSIYTWVTLLLWYSVVRSGNGKPPGS